MHVASRRPNNNKCSFVNEIENFLTFNSNNNIIICGDINLNLLDSSDKNVQNYEGVLAGNGFYKCINGVTREEMILDKVSETCIDHIFLRGHTDLTRAAIYKTKLTDHYMVLVDTRFKDNASKNHNHNLNSQISDRKINEKKLKQKLEACDWSKLRNINDCDGLYENMFSIFKKCYDDSTFLQSVKSKKTRHIKSWMTEDLLAATKQRDRLFHKWKNCNNALKSVYRSDYKTYRNEVNKQIWKAKIKHYKDDINNGKNLKETWQSINKILGKPPKKSVDEVISKHLGKKLSHLDIANSFVESFKNEIVQIQHKCNYSTDTDRCTGIGSTQSMYMPRVTSLVVSRIINSMEENKQPGFDNIRIKDLKLLVDVISPIIAKLINLSIKNGLVPNKLKISVVRPVYKKGSHLLFSNYRPVAILPFIEKTMEECVAVILTTYLTDYGIINKFQYGFQKGKSTSDLLLQFSDYINSKLNDNMHVVAMFIDFSKAFDTLNHQKLIAALETIGVRGPLLNWFKSYLDNRKMVVKIKNDYSMCRHSTSGVPQGSILGPILYIIYVNDMFTKIKLCKTFMYADDTVLLSAHKDLKTAERNLQKDFTNLLCWTHDNDLVINASKTKIIHICSPFNRDKVKPVNIVYHSFSCLHDRTLHINECNCNETIEVVDSHKYLGITVDKHFTWKTHIANLCKRLRSVALQMYNLKCILPFNLLRTVYIALAESLVSYGLLAWGNASAFYLQSIFSIQCKMLKTLASPSLKKHSSCDHVDLFKYCKLLPIQQMYKYRLILKFYYDSNYRIINAHPLSTRLRLLNNYKIPKYINKHGKRALKYVVPSTLNSLPKELRKISKYKILKHEIKNWISDNM